MLPYIAYMDPMGYMYHYLDLFRESFLVDRMLAPRLCEHQGLRPGQWGNPEKAQTAPGHWLK